MIIGICGKAGSGKDTFADILVRDHNFVKIAFADVLKRFVRDVFGFSVEQLWGPSEKRNEPDFRYPRGEDAEGETEYLTPRFALQQLGTEYGRTCYGPIWGEYLLRTAKTLLGPVPMKYTATEGLSQSFAHDYVRPAGVVVPDVRFLNEVQNLQRAGAQVLHITRPGKEGLTGAAAAHLSETELDGIPREMFNGHLVNSGPLEDLIVLAQGFVMKFGIEQRDRDFTKMLDSIPSTDIFALMPVPSAGITSQPTPPPPQVVHQAELVEDEPAQEVPVVFMAPPGSHLESLMKQREADVEAGRILPYDPSQSDIPPFKRTPK